MKHVPSPTLTPFRFAQAALALLALGANARAASTNWVASPTDANWATGANWAAGTAPGITTFSGNATRSTDVATFSQAIGGSGFGGSASPVVIDTNRFIKGITFATGAGAYVIGSSGGNLLQLDNAGSILVQAGVTNAQVIANPVQVRQASSNNATYTFQNDSTTTAATLTFTAATFTLTSANGRPTTLTLAGANTGDNTISSNITDLTASQAVNVITKSGAGTWILSGANTFTGTGATTAANGIQINGGVLSARNNAALGTNTTANTNQVSINNTGTLELANGITLDNGLSLNLNSGGAIRSSGSTTTSGRVNVGTAASTSVTLSTVGASDVFTVGNGTNDLTGGAADSVINISGPGTVFQNVASNYAGNWSLNAGTLRLGSSTALGLTTTSVAFGASSTGKLQLNGNSATIGGLSTNATPGTPVVENGVAGTTTLTVSNASANTFAGVLQNGAAGTLALTKSGAGLLTLSGANTYTGATNVNVGILKVNGSVAGAVNVASLATLGGAGTVSGLVTVASGGILAPGNSVGTLTVGSLSLGTGSQLDYEFNNSPANDFINVTGANGLTLNGAASDGAGFNLYQEGGVSAFNTNGTYNLLGFAGSIQGTGTSSLKVLNPQGGKSYTFGTAGSNVTLQIATSGVITAWASDTSGDWDLAGNWSNGVPNAANHTAQLTASLSAPRTIALNGNKTVASLTLDGGANGYVIANGSTASVLSLNNGASQANLIVSSSANSISSGLSLDSTSNVVAVASGASLDLSGVVAGAGALTKSGVGTLNLSGTANTYAGGTGVSGGTLAFSGLGSLGSGNLSLDGATLRYNPGNTADISSRTVTFGTLGVTLDTNGNDVTFAAAVGNSGAGSLVKTGLGVLTLSGANTYTGATSVTGGAVSISDNSNLGPAATGATLTLNGGALVTTATFSLDNAGANARTLALGASGGTVTTAPATTLSVTGSLSGSSTLTKNGAGSLVLAGNNSASFTGPVALNAGAIALGGAQSNGQQGLGTGAVTFGNGTALSLNGRGAADAGGTYGTLSNALVVPSGQTATLNLPKRVTLNSTLTGAGTLNVDVDGGFDDFQGNWSAFTGQINATASSGAGQVRLSNFQNNVFNNSRLNLGAGVTLSQVFNPPTGSGTVTVQPIGELSGASGSVIAGNPVGGRFVNWSVGSLNTGSEFAGVIQDSAGAARLTKVGTGTLILSGNNTFTGGATVSAGTLQVGNGGTSGTLGAGPVTNNAVLAFNRADTLSVANVISGTGSLVQNGGGTITLSGSNTYSGGTAVNAGTLAAGSTTAFGTGTITIFSGATLNLASQAIGNPITNNGGAITGLNTATPITQTGGSLSGTIGSGTLNGTIGGNFSSSGTISGSPTFTGTVKGSGTTFAGVVTFANGSTHAPGNSPGFQTFDSGLTYNAGSTLEWEFAGGFISVTSDAGLGAGTDYDWLAGNGTVTIAPTAVIKLVDFGGAVDYSTALWNNSRVFSVIGSLSGAISGTFTLDASGAGDATGQGAWSLNYDNSGGSGIINAVWTPVVPEPSTYAALAGLAALGLALRRRRAR